MKTLSSFLIIFIFIFTTLTLNSPPSSADDEVYNDCDKFVCDHIWFHVKTNETYRIGPPLISFEKGTPDIILESTVDDHPCPRNGIILGDNNVYGDYFTFTPIVPTDDGRLPLETPFSISVDEKSDSCNETDRYLRTTRRNNQVGFWHVTGDGEFNTSSSCFQFVINSPLQEDVRPKYLLQNCPGKCGGQTAKCFGVGNRTEDGYDYLTTELGLVYDLEIRNMHEFLHFAS